ncbi:F-box-like protein [Ceratobasidium sp. AG-Ba]|nr:F-box-like protein [Ceratobasidium sp. AG-Ba]
MSINNQLPPEVLGYIFLVGHRAEQKERRNIRSCAHDDPDFRHLVTWVCRAWRFVAFRTPQLWTDININDCRSWGNYCSLYYVFLAYRNQPTDIYVDLTSRFIRELSLKLGVIWSQTTMHIVDYLFENKHPRQWRTLNIRISGEDIVPRSFMEGLARFQFLKLESFTLIGYRRGDVSLENELDQVAIRPLTSKSSRLASVHLRHFSLGYLNVQFDASFFSNLTCLELGLLDAHPSLLELETILKRNPGLRIFRLCLGDLGAAVSKSLKSRTERCILPFLQELSIRNCRQSDWAESFLSNMSAPGVTKLRIIVHKSQVGSWESFAKGIARDQSGRPMFPRLTHLVANLSTRELEIVLSAYSGLVRLDIFKPTYDNHELLTLLTRSPFLVPPLRSLWVDGRGDLDVQGLAEARRAAGMVVAMVKTTRMDYAAYFS